MATLSGNGGAQRYWRNARDHSRLALCRNGQLLRQRQPGGRWWITTLLLDDVSRDPAWRGETTTVASAGITRTTREARRHDRSRS
ncbi:MAG: hypothetical protein J2P48_23885 [Alphaproteobacteria bacterium]|nr:hypothetical protein [Alphaproteobacteria bacterium]